jgi:hypothetical protein
MGLVWAFINTIAECVNAMVSNHNVRTERVVEFWLMMFCDIQWQDQCWQALGNLKSGLKNHLFLHLSSYPHGRCHKHHRLTLRIKNEQQRQRLPA